MKLNGIWGNSFKKTALVIMLIIGFAVPTLAGSAGCYTEGDFVEEFGTTDFNLIALREIEGIHGEPAFLGSGEINPFNGVLFALEIKPSEIAIVRFAFEDVIIIYKDIEQPYVRLSITKTDYTDAQVESRFPTPAGKIQALTKSCIIYIKKESLYDFISFW
jgi:hypothetical protein